MPITMPKIVRPLRTLLAESAVYVSCYVSFIVISRRIGEVMPRGALFVGFLVGNDKTVADHDDALRVFGHIGFVRDENDGASVFLVQFLERAEYDLAGFR